MKTYSTNELLQFLEGYGNHVLKHARRTDLGNKVSASNVQHWLTEELKKQERVGKTKIFSPKQDIKDLDGDTVFKAGWEYVGQLKTTGLEFYENELGQPQFVTFVYLELMFNDVNGPLL